MVQTITANEEELQEISSFNYPTFKTAEEEDKFLEHCNNLLVMRELQARMHALGFTVADGEEN